MVSIEHNVNNMYTGMLTQQNTTMIKNDLYDLYNRTNSLLHYNDQQLVELNYRKNQSIVIKNKNHGEIASKDNSTTSFLTQYFTFMSYWIGNL
jgi:formylmethanofuran dehydrogenase subunit D